MHTGCIFGLLAEMTDRENTKVREGSLGQNCRVSDERWGVSGGHFLIFSIHLGVCVARGFIQFLYHSCVNLGNVDKRYLLLNYFQGHKQHATKLKTYECKEVRWIICAWWLVGGKPSV